MENTQEEKEFSEDLIPQKDFEDFEDSGINVDSEMDNDLISQETETEQEEPEKTEEAKEEDNKISQNEQEIPKEAPISPLSPWEEFEQENSAIKKYIFYVSKDFVPYIDNLTTDERSAYINDAIQKKIDFEIQEKKANTKKRVVAHFVIMALTFVLSMPIVLFVCHKAIMATFDNYKYSQENFEKLYKERFSKDKAYMRSIQYNKKQEAKKQNK